MPEHPWSPICPPPRGLVRPVPVDPTGARGPTRSQARGRHWRQTSHGFYVPAAVDADRPEQRVLEQSVRLPAGGAVTGWAACRLAGATFFDGLAADGRTRSPVPLAVGPRARIRGDDRVTLSRDRLAAEEVVLRHGVPCARALRSLFDAMRTAPGVRTAVVAMDMMAAAELVSIQQMAAYVLDHAGWTGVERVRRALPLASEDSRSPKESEMRLIWVLDAGLPPPRCNKPVFDGRGRLIGYPDLLDVEAGVVGEYDGADHRGALRHSKDVAREEDFRRAGLEYFTVTGPDLCSPRRVVERMRFTRSRARWLAAAERRWTIEPPPGWFRSPLESMSLDELLAYRAGLRDLSREA